MEKKKRYLFGLNAIISVLAVIFIAVALGTQYWIVADPRRSVDDEIQTADYGDGRFEGYFHAGLFAGKKRLDYGYGPREGEVEGWFRSCIV